MLYQVLKNGKRQVIRILLPGDFVGAVPNIHWPMRHSAVCLTESMFCAFPPLTRMVQADPRLFGRISTLQAETMERTTDYFVCVARRNATERVCFLLLDLYERLRVRGLVRGCTIAFSLTQADIADALGLTAIHVNRVLHGLTRQRLLTIKHHALTILDHGAVRELADLETAEPAAGRLAHLSSW